MQRVAKFIFFPSCCALQQLMTPELVLSWSLVQNLKRKAENFQGGYYVEGLGGVALAVHLRGEHAEFL